MTDKECLMGYYFAREKGKDTITCIGGFGDRIEKDINGDVEILEKIPTKVMEHVKRGVKILNLREIMGRKSR